MTHTLFLVKRAVYIYTWGIRNVGSDGKISENDQGEIERSLVLWVGALQHRVPGCVLMLVLWVDALQHRVPGCVLMLVATRTDLATPQQVNDQCNMVKAKIQERIKFHKQSRIVMPGQKRKERITFHKQSRIVMPGQDDSDIVVYNDGDSVRVNNRDTKGIAGDWVRVNNRDAKGIAELRDKLVAFAKGTRWYAEKIRAQVIKLRDEIASSDKDWMQWGEYVEVIKLRDEIASSDKDWMQWEEYVEVCYSCGIVDRAQQRMATMFLHDMGVIRYFGDHGLDQTVISPVKSPSSPVKGLAKRLTLILDD
ncbi:hypothetical protein T484DRAFT_1792236 [Baffinella frigidus]|nr:hypothetical protein T484DRAFT_1792236 [Cryptophyta sp. CCMP2293]